MNLFMAGWSAAAAVVFASVNCPYWALACALAATLSMHLELWRGK